MPSFKGANDAMINADKHLAIATGAGFALAGVKKAIFYACPAKVS
jgi:hypothetical protein